MSFTITRKDKIQLVEKKNLNILEKSKPQHILMLGGILLQIYFMYWWVEQRV